ncbi:MAG: RNA-binding protein [Deltaproteobacteria bacterium]|nr:MAG: RNA-binding protein [Deltaproteobacteria bacterium]RLB01447.1 MAG: RNA-binding protein [Deltaproteobacteria bacterium]
MCQSTAYLIKDGKEEEFLTDIASIVPEEGRIRLVNLFGEEKVVEAEIEEINLLEHRILLRPLK